MKVKMWSLLVLFFSVLGTAVSQAGTEDAEKLLEEKCQKQGAPNAMTAIRSKKQSIEECITEQNENIEFKTALQEALITGSKGKMFAAYCKLWPELYNCMTPITVIIRPCLTETEQQTFDKSLDIAKDSLKYMCFRDGERIATFIDNGGMECFQQQQKDITKCARSIHDEQSTKPKNISTAISPTLTLTEDQCQDFNKLRRCVNVELKECENPTPAKVVDDLIRLWSKEMECPIINSAVTITESILVTLVMFLLVKLY